MPEEQPEKLVCTRLQDMTQMHPNQIEAECCNCHHKVGVYPTGQRAMKKWPKMGVWCVNCASLDRRLIDQYKAAGSLTEILQEMRESKPVIIQ